MTYRTEFPDFPPETMPAIPATWEDASWGAEGCPHFIVDDFAVWVDYLDHDLREMTEGLPRFAVYRCDDTGGHLADEPDFVSDDFDAVLAWLAVQP